MRTWRQQHKCARAWAGNDWGWAGPHALSGQLPACLCFAAGLGGGRAPCRSLPCSAATAHAPPALHALQDGVRPEGSGGAGEDAAGEGAEEAAVQARRSMRSRRPPVLRAQSSPQPGRRGNRRGEGRIGAAAGEGAEEAQEAAVQVRSAWAVGGWAQGMHGRQAGRHAWRSPRWVPCSAVTATLLLLPCMLCSMMWGWRAAAVLARMPLARVPRRRRRQQCRCAVPGR